MEALLLFKKFLIFFKIAWIFLGLFFAKPFWSNVYIEIFSREIFNLWQLRCLRIFLYTRKIHGQCLPWRWLRKERPSDLLAPRALCTLIEPFLTPITVAWTNLIDRVCGPQINGRLSSSSLRLSLDHPILWCPVSPHEISLSSLIALIVCELLLILIIENVSHIHVQTEGWADWSLGHTGGWERHRVPLYCSHTQIQPDCSMTPRIGSQLLTSSHTFDLMCESCFNGTHIHTFQHFHSSAWLPLQFIHSFTLIVCVCV